MGKRLIWVVALASVLGACTDDPEGSVTTTTAAASSTTQENLPAVTDPGRLAIVDASGNIAVMDPDGSNRIALTDRGDNPSLFMQPVWSPDGSRLAWGQRTGSGFAIGIGRPGTDENKALTTPNLPYYIYWSPDGRHLGALHNGDLGVQFQIADIDAETAELLDEDDSFYFSWSPSGDQVVTHAGVSRTQTITPDGERADLDPTSGAYLAPQWTPTGVFHVVDNALMLEDEEGKRTPVADVSGLTMFVANPQGSHVALQTTGGEGPVTASTEEFPTVASDTVVVVDVRSGEVTTVDDSLAVGFFWSPDGKSLLVMTTTESQVLPIVWTLDGDVREYSAYRPSRAMLEQTLPFFPQYAQSVSFWAPDSSAFAFAGRIDDERGIWVQPVDQDTPTKVDDGVWVAWSPARP